MPVCLLLTSLGLAGLILVAVGAVKVTDPPPPPDAPPPPPSTFPGWWVVLLIFAAVGLLMWVLSEIAAPA
jgi:hypothetical protein